MKFITITEIHIFRIDYFVIREPKSILLHNISSKQPPTGTPAQILIIKKCFFQITRFLLFAIPSYASSSEFYRITDSITIFIHILVTKCNQIVTIIACKHFSNRMGEIWSSLSTKKMYSPIAESRPEFLEALNPPLT